MDDRRCQQLEVRVTADERALIDLAVASRGGDLNEFLAGAARHEARRVLAGRESFLLAADQVRACDGLIAQPVRELARLRKRFERPSPFSD